MIEQKVISGPFKVGGMMLSGEKCKDQWKVSIYVRRDGYDKPEYFAYEMPVDAYSNLAMFFQKDLSADETLYVATDNEDVGWHHVNGDYR